MVQFNEANKAYYSEDFIKGFNIGAKRQAERVRTGRWIKEGERNILDTRMNINVKTKEATGVGYRTYIHNQCSECRKTTMHDESIWYKFCPHCGARMEVVNGSEDTYRG